MNFIDTIKERAKQDIKTIVLPETEDVRTLQANLKKALSIELATDGDFGSKTEDAVKAFQKKYKLTVNGIYNTTTANKMKAVLNG